MAALHSRCGHYTFVLFLSSSFFFSLSYLSGCRLDVYHTSTHVSANLECRSEMYCMRLAENMGHKKSQSRHHRMTLSGYIFATKACINNRKENLLNSNTSCICPHNMVNFGPLTAEISSGVCGTPANFSGFALWQRYCTAL